MNDVNFTFRLPAALLEAMRRLAARLDRSPSWVARKAVEKMIEKEGKE